MTWLGNTTIQLGKHTHIHTHKMKDGLSDAMRENEGGRRKRSEVSRVDGREAEIVRREYRSLHSEVRNLTKRDLMRQMSEKVAESETLINKNNGQSPLRN